MPSLSPLLGSSAWSESEDEVDDQTALLNRLHTTDIVTVCE